MNKEKISFDQVILDSTQYILLEEPHALRARENFKVGEALIYFKNNNTWYGIIAEKLEDGYIVSDNDEKLVALRKRQREEYEYAKKIEEVVYYAEYKGLTPEDIEKIKDIKREFLK